MDADLVLEGGGVKGIGLVGAISVLEEKGYVFHRVAGTSAGSIVGSLVAAGMPVATMQRLISQLDYRRFRDAGTLDHFGLLGKGLSLIFEKGVYEGDFLRNWLGEQLAALGVHTFGDLKITDDAGSALPPERAYRLVVMTADVSRGELVRLPWDYPRYGLDPDSQPVAQAVRCSMSIPFFYEPVKVKDAHTGQTSYFVDGGVLSNFPIDVFDRPAGEVPRWPTFGVKLSARPDANQVAHPDIDGPVKLGTALLDTMMNAHDQMHLDDPCVQARTIFVDTDRIQSTNFDITQEQQQLLHANGRTAAQNFLQSWNFESYKQTCRGDGTAAAVAPAAAGATTG